MHRVAEEVPHRDAPLHGGDRGEHEDPGAVTGGVDASRRRARNPVDVDETAVLEDHAGFLQPEVGGVGNRAERQQAVRAGDRAAVGQLHGDPVARRGVTDSIRDLSSTSMPRRVKTSSRTLAASASSPGSTRSRLDTSVTSTPSAL